MPQIPQSDPLLNIRNLRKSFGKHEVLTDINLAVRRGEVVSIIGPSGSGKTTLLRCVNFLESYEGGSITIDGKEVGYAIEGQSVGLGSGGEGVGTASGGQKVGFASGGKRRGERELARMRAETGMVFQGFNLFPHLTAAQNVMLGLTRVRGKSKAEAREIAAKWLGRVGLGHKLDSLPSELSGGQQQRVGIARAVAMEPKILLLDEITSALDPELVGEVLEVVRGLAAEGMTMLMVTHEIAFARDAAHRIVFMADGRINAEGEPRALLAASEENPRLDGFLARFRASHF